MDEQQIDQFEDMLTIDNETMRRLTHEQAREQYEVGNSPANLDADKNYISKI